ncbi:MAG: DUF1553 domain-containing protein, partial [Planctomycetota bacterium]|nr:DUF1553 domain-containing protein [Planctomycetota bacterium]
MQQQGLKPSQAADRYALIRRASLDLTGLPPTVEEVDAFVNNTRSDAYEQLIDRLLDSTAYGERWAVMWLDLARYADSAGYANDPQRTIWLYRDWVIKAFNSNMAFDQFTLEQIGGDLLDDATESNVIATAFHRNTLTQSEGGTNDEEFRNSAVIDRTNTTMQVWMGTTIRCAQCHDHKYDPISQEEYFKVFAFFNNTEDADRADEQPLLSVTTDEQNETKARLERELVKWKQQQNADPETLQARLDQWKQANEKQISWVPIVPSEMTATSGAELQVSEDGIIVSTGVAAPTDTYQINFKTALQKITAIRIEALADPALPGGGPGRAGNGNFVLTELSASGGNENDTSAIGKIVRLDLKGANKMIHVAEIEVFSGGKNVALKGVAKQSSTDFGGAVQRANDGNTNGDYTANSVTHTAIQTDPWIEIELEKSVPIDSLSIWNRTDNNLQGRLDGFEISILNDQREVIWKQRQPTAPKTNVDFDISGLLPIVFTGASATFEQRESGKVNQFAADKAIDGDASTPAAGWAIGGAIGKDQAAVFQLQTPLGGTEETTIKLWLAQKFDQHPLGRFRISLTTAPAPVGVLPHEITALLDVSWEAMTAGQQETVRKYYQRVVPPTKEVTDKIAALEKQIKAIPKITVPVMRELAMDKRRKTHVQVRGNFEVLEQEVSAGTPSVFHPFPDNVEMNRLELARWLVSPDNPLTGRVVVNRYWEQLFGQGLVRTSEEFGIQGDPPTHPQLLDWLAVTFVKDYRWDIKRLLKAMVMSATYRQDAQVTSQHRALDPYNHYLARGPRFRLNAEMIRDQALAVSGLLSRKMYGPSVRPPRPQLGLKAAFGSSTDWATSAGDDKFRRGLYTQWRRSLPYPSMSTFDAPNRNVCTISRGRTNTPLQALVTLNDPVYVEAAQALARRMMAEGGETISQRLTYGFRLALSRPPHDQERQRLEALYVSVQQQYAEDPDSAMELATIPLGPLPEGVDADVAAAWTVVGNVLLNLDETLAKR